MSTGSRKGESAQPRGFEDLARYRATWGLPTRAQRRERRLASTLDELRDFHDAVLPRLEEIIEFLNQFPVEAIPEEHQSLAWMALAMCEVDDPVNKWGTVVLEEALDPRKFQLKKSFVDIGPEDEYGAGT